MTIPVPMLSTQGWVKELSAKIDALLAHYISTDNDQSNTYSGNLSSLQFVIEQHNNDPLATSTAVSDSVRRYLARYYENVMAEARFTLVDETESQTLVKITLSLNFTEDGINYTANRLLTYFNGKFQSIVEVNNG